MENTHKYQGQHEHKVNDLGRASKQNQMDLKENVSNLKDEIEAMVRTTHL